MKAILLFFSLVCIQTLQAQSTDRTPLIVKKTATWCNPCGTWGWTLQEDVVLQNPDAIIMQLHNSTSSQLFSSDGLSIYNQFINAQSSTPGWYVDLVNQTAYSTSGGIYTTTTKNNIRNASDSTLLQTPLANANFTYSLNGNSLTVQTTTKFFDNAIGEYYVGAYILEKNVIKYQNGIGNTANHETIFRSAVGTNVFGEVIPSQNITSGQTFTHSFSETLDASWNAANLQLFVTIWKKTGSSYTIVNSWSTKALLTSKDAQNPWTASVLVYPNPVQDQFSLNIVSEKSENMQLNIKDLTGKIVYSENLGEIREKQIQVTRPQHLSAGLYLVEIKGNSGSVIQKITFE